MALKNNINTYADMAAYNADSTKEYPNVSYIIATDEVVWMESEPIVPKAIYNVTSTSLATTLLNSATGITKQIIDGIEQSSVVTEYTFNTTGEHVVEYELANNQIGDNAFRECTNLTSITIPNTVTTIGDSAFKYCGLANVTIGNSVTIIGDSAFQYCDNLTSIIIPDSVTTIGDWAFYQCANLTTVTIGNSVTSIGKYAFQSCYNLTSITIPNSVTTIGDSAFIECSSLANVTIGNSVTTIGENAFRECSNLTNVTIGNSVTSIALSAFFGCSSLTNITIPDSVTSIDNWAFFDCSRLANVTVEASTPPTLGSDVFVGNASGRKIYVPSASVSTYQSASGWSTYASAIVAIQNS